MSKSKDENKIELIETDAIQIKEDYIKQMLEESIDDTYEELKRIREHKKSQDLLKDQDVCFDEFAIKFESIEVVDGINPNLFYLSQELVDVPFRKTSKALKEKNLIDEPLYNILFLQDQFRPKNKFLIEKFILPEFKKQVQQALFILDRYSVYKVRNTKKELYNILTLFFEPNYLKEVDR